MKRNRKRERRNERKEKDNQGKGMNKERIKRQDGLERGKRLENM